MTQTDNHPLLSVRNIECVFRTAERKGFFGSPKSLQAVSDVSFDIHRGEAFGVVGESGCGKSTTAKVILNMARLAAGDILFDGQPITGLGKADWKPLRKRIQYVFQDPLGALDPRMTVVSQVIEPLTIHRIGTARERGVQAAEMLETVGIGAHQFAKFPHELSGGQRQRVVLARALILKPDLLICDEPISALDVSIQAQIINLLGRLRKDMGLTLMFISHDLAVVRHLCNRMAVMYLGKIVEQGPTDRLVAMPRHPYTRALLSAIPTSDAAQRAERITLQGEPPSPIDPPSGCRFHPRCHRAIARCRDGHPPALEVGPAHFAACIQPENALQEASI